MTPSSFCTFLSPSGWLLIPRPCPRLDRQPKERKSYVAYFVSRTGLSFPFMLNCNNVAMGMGQKKGGPPSAPGLGYARN